MSRLSRILLELMTNTIMRQNHMSTILQFLFFLSASSIECMIEQYCLIFVLQNKWKNLLFITRKIKRKNKFPGYPHPSSIEMMKIIRKQSINEKPPNLVTYWGGKLKDSKCVWWKTF